MKGQAARIWAENGWIKFRAVYDPSLTPAFAESLKLRIPWKLRQWSPSEKVWMVDPSALDDLVEIARRFFPDVVISNSGNGGKQERVQKEHFQDCETPYDAMADLMKVASFEAMKKVYKTLALDLHPDHGGDGDTMRVLNTAWDKICQQRGVK